MKTLLYVFVVVVFYTAPLYAQTPPASQAIPELQEWWRAPADEKGLGEYGVFYLPNFYHGKDAMAVSTKDGTMETWLNRFPGDRENVFTWQTSGTVLYGDLNADGIRDYVCGTRIYRGIQNGEPPESGTIRAINMKPNMVVDVNHDGYVDIVDCYEGGSRIGSGLVGQIIFGGPDFKEMKTVQLPFDIVMDSTMYVEQMYMGKDGDLRILMFAYDLVGDPRRDFGAYILFRAQWKTGDTLPTYEKLVEEIRYYDTDIPFQRGGTIYQSKYDSNIYFMIKESLGMLKHNLLIYNISKDTFELKTRYRKDNVYPFMLNGSIDGDNYEDWVMRTGTGKSKLFFFSGNNITDSQPMSMHDPICDGNLGGAKVIGDVNGDSVNDVAVYLESSVAPNCLRILLGRKESTGVGDPAINIKDIFSLTDPTPHPLSRGKTGILSANILKSGDYYLELVDISGKHVAELKRQYLEAGSQSIMLDITSIPIASGSYILRLKNETGMILGQRTIIIE